jgi:hypothetical protein
VLVKSNFPLPFILARQPKANNTPLRPSVFPDRLQRLALLEREEKVDKAFDGRYADVAVWDMQVDPFRRLLPPQC